VSGRELVRRMYDNYISENTIMSNLSSFYIYGNIETPNGLEKVNSTYSSGFTDSKVLVVITVTIDPDNEYMRHISIVSKGNVQGEIESVKYKFKYILSSGSSEPTPPTVESGGAIDAASPPSGEPWYTSSTGNLINNPSGYSSTVPVLFNEGVTISKESNSPADLKAPSMYFQNKPVSLFVKKNMTLVMVSNFISFSGSVNSGGSSDLELNIYSSTIDGSSISGVPGIKYGIIYLGGSLSGSSISSGYYYFPSGINLYSQSSQLIRINGFDSIPSNILNMLNAQISPGSGGVSNGTFS
jgi:hypothetical protein